MDALTALRTRRSIRKYENRTVPREHLQTMVDCARLATTARGVQPWEFVVITNQHTREQLAAICEYGKFLSQAPAAIVVFCHDTKYYLEDGCNATECLLIAATALGLGTCWIAGDKKPYADTIRQLVGAPEDAKLIAIITVGYPAESPSPQKRSLQDVLHWEKF
ncbi:MAG TPA: nitroreductase family protein [Armatimonadota bacterium]|nr:nitroreductase family protein [Armatimonadota bacterium]